MPLDKIFDRKTVIDFFKKVKERQRFSSAYLFAGEAEEEKKNTAIELAKLIICKDGYKDNCSCSSCKRIDSLEHPDVFWIEALGELPSIKINQIRELRRKIILKPYEAEKKVFIINQAQNMTEASQNALLKTLEEPPKDSILLLISLSTKGLLETIISRCKIIKFGKKEDISAKLQRSEIIDNFLSIKDNNIEDFFNCQTKEQFLIIIESLLSLYRDILLLKSKADKSLLLNQDKEDMISKLIDFYTHEDVYKIIDFLNEMCRYVSFNVRLKICLINTIFFFKKIMRVEVA